MPSPFPGMDPYLENPLSWTDFHQSFIVYIRVALVPRLPPDYIARIEERVYLLPPSDREVIPDAYVVHRASSAGARRRAAVGISDYDPPVVLTIPSMQIRESYIEIRDKKNNERVVTVIEVLSPTNKAPNSRGQRLYRDKQRQVLESQTHLVEIDLLRDGAYAIAAPQEVLREETRWDYLVCLHRGEEDERFEVCPVSLRERLPRIAIPLDKGIKDISLNLQAVLDSCFEDNGYAVDIDYTRPPVPPLQDEDAAWAEKRLRERRRDRGENEPD